jgi:hypothetical protein
MPGDRIPHSTLAFSRDRHCTQLHLTMRFISLDAQGTYTATVCGVEIPVMVDSHICTWVEAHAAEMCKDPNVNLGFDECRIWIYQNWAN